MAKEEREVRWQEADVLEERQGVALHHAGFRAGMAGFIVGFGWLRSPTSIAVVKLAKMPAGHDKAAWGKLIEEVKEAAKYYMAHKGGGKKVGGNVQYREYN